MTLPLSNSSRVVMHVAELSELDEIDLEILQLIFERQPVTNFPLPLPHQGSTCPVCS